MTFGEGTHVVDLVPLSARPFRKPSGSSSHPWESAMSHFSSPARATRCAYFELIDAQIRVLAAIDHVGLIANRIAAFCSLAGRAREEERRLPFGTSGPILTFASALLPRTADRWYLLPIESQVNLF